MDTETLARRLAAAEKTIAVLMRRAEKKMASGESAFAILEQNVALERVVQEKTRLLDAQRAELQAALNHLGKAQGELMQAQKLESVGRLASGIAHELNTPVQFVNDNVHFLRDATAQLLALVQRYGSLRERVAAGTADAAAAAELTAAEEEIELDFLTSNVPRAVERTLEGLGRVASLVRSLKEFAHPEQSHPVPSDLNRCLTTTLTVARNEYRYVADVETSFGELPLVTCHPGSLNQVFLNLIVNAAHAIEGVERPEGQRGAIRIETRLEGEVVCIAISDSGTGIPEGIRDQIYDPFFTTKPPGKGTGQGLAISRNVVVDQHGGTITFESTLGRGTTFLIRLPVHGAPDTRRPRVPA